jgi:protoporphyrinogen oxidase
MSEGHPVTQKIAIIIGAGPAGLTAAYELSSKTDIKPIIYEMTEDIGGISKTVNYKGNRIDIGGHRFFSKSDRVMQWWLNILPLQEAPAKDDIISGKNPFIRNKTQQPANQKKSQKYEAPNPEKNDRVMLIRRRLSRIFFLRKFFNYPVSLNYKTLSHLGPIRIIKIILSYMKIQLFPIRESSLEDFFINRFGKELYLTFFKDYTEKVWGVPCNRIKPEWGAQRIKGLSVTKAVLHAIKNITSKDSSITQKKTETSLIEQFLYPKFGPGQMWETVAKIVKERGGETYLMHRVVGIKSRNNKIIEVKVKDEITGEVETKKGDYFFSTMPVKEFIEAFDESVPQQVKEVAQGLLYRDFITVGLLLRKLKIRNDTKIKTINNNIPDNWIYIQERDVKLARLQIFNNWSPYMVKDVHTVWIGLEYVCNEGDMLWNKSDGDLSEFAADELSQIGIIDKEDVLDSIVIRMQKTYPAYFGSYDHFHIIRKFTDSFENLFLIGRNGMHRYNNQDHSMLTAMTAVENIINNIRSKDNIWAINIEKEYHEEK